MKKNYKILTILICLSVFVASFSACKGGEVSGEESKAQSEAALSSEVSLDESETMPGNGAESGESSEQNSSEDSSSADESAEVSSDVSEDTSTEGMSWDEALEKYKDLESVKVIWGMEDKITGPFKVDMTGDVEYSGYLFEMKLEMYGEPESEDSFSVATMTGMGQVIMSEKELVLDGVTYGIDDTTKTYCIIPEEEEEPFLGFDSIKEVVTKNELVKGQIYVVDWFVSTDGSKLGIYSKDSEIKYLAMSMDVGDGTNMDIIFDMSIQQLEEKMPLELPEGYSLVDYDSFQGGSSL